MFKRESNEIKHRVFLVGCPRSGTTLLQVILANHSETISFPESHFFAKLYPKHEPKRKLFHLASRRAKPHLYSFLDSIHVSELKSLIHPWTLFPSQYITCFVKALDYLALETGKQTWIEKTPDHLHYINEIEKTVKSVKFIHVMRNGLDVIASLYEVTRKYPNIWRGPWSIDYCIEHWTRAIETSEKYASKDNHILIKYTDLSEKIEIVLRDLCDFLDLEFEPNMQNQANNKNVSLILENEPWKLRSLQKISASKQTKYNYIFSESQKRYIAKKLSEKSINPFFRDLTSF